MSKLGRYSADRKKIEAVADGDAKVVEVHDCGTVFTIAGGSGNGGNAITLPSISAAGKGWWCKFVLIDDLGSTATTIVAASGDEDLIVAAVYGGLGDSTNADTTAQDKAADGVTFVASKALAGDQVEVICTGSKWLLQAFSTDGDAAITVQT
jgi:hypothetical protein